MSGYCSVIILPALEFIFFKLAPFDYFKFVLLPKLFYKNDPLASIATLHVMNSQLGRNEVGFADCRVSMEQGVEFGGDRKVGWRWRGRRRKDWHRRCRLWPGFWKPV